MDTQGNFIRDVGVLFEHFGQDLQALDAVVDGGSPQTPAPSTDPAPTTDPAPAPAPARALLQPSDFTHKGVRLLNTSDHFAFSSGAMAGYKKPNGQRIGLVGGHWDHIIEIDLDTGAELAFHASTSGGRTQFPKGAGWGRGLRVVGEDLYCTYSHPYNPGESVPQHMLYITDLATFTNVRGPFYMAPSGHYTGGYCIVRPSDGALLFGAPLMSGIAMSPMGPNLVNAGPPPLQGGLTFETRIQTRPFLTYPFDSSSGPITRCARPATYTPYYADPNQTNRRPVNGVGYWTDNDIVSGGEWFDFGDKFGLVFFGHLANGQLFYGAPLFSLDPLIKDESDEGTGPHCQHRSPRWWIYNPERLPGTIPMIPDHQWEPSIPAPIGDGAVETPIQVGSWHDREARELFVCGGRADPYRTYPAIHKWGIA